VSQVVKDLLTFPVNLTIAAYRIATWANFLAIVGVVGSAAQAISVNQPILNVAFGTQKGATLSIIAIAVSHAATTLASHGEPIQTEVTPKNPVAVTVQATNLTSSGDSTSTDSSTKSPIAVTVNTSSPSVKVTNTTEEVTSTSTTSPA